MMHDSRRVSESHTPTAIVIGGGVIGCFAAYYLTQHGWKVQIIEAGRVGGGCSHGNCGFICPSHVLPLTMPGAVWPVMKKMFRRDSSIYVRPRWDPALWRWFARFARTCNRESMQKAAAARHALLSSSMALYRQLLAEEKLDVEWEDGGLLLVFHSQHDFDAYEKIAALMRSEFNIEVVGYDAAQLAKLEPSLRPGAAGAWHYTGDSHLRPSRLMSALATLLRSRGVEVLEQTRVTQIHVENHRARAVETSAGRLQADVVLLATGARAPEFAKQLGIRIPIQPGKGYSITMPRPKLAPTRPIIFEEHHVAVTPWASGLRVGSTMEFTGYDTTINRRRIDLFKQVARENLVEAPLEAVEEEWCGWRPMTCDDLPCIGHVPTLENVVIAAGHGMIGMATATSTGKLAAEIATGAKPHIDAAPFSLQRFAT